jgi:hypothetical protein
MIKETDTLWIELAAVEKQIVDWKRRETSYGTKGLRAPAHVTRRIEELKQDARLLRAQIGEKR